MGKYLLVCAATAHELSALDQVRGLVREGDKITFNGMEIKSLVTGIGTVLTTWSLAEFLISNETPLLAINIGIAGSYREDIPVGSVVVPTSDTFGDLGIEDGESRIPFWETGLPGFDTYPFSNGLVNCHLPTLDIAGTLFERVKAITVNMATGSDETISRMRGNFDPDIETMEGAAFYYVCSRISVPFVALRSISNMVERRNIKNWNIPLAIGNLAKGLQSFIEKIGDEWN